MQFDVRQMVAGALTFGFFIALLHMMLTEQSTSIQQEITVSVVTTTRDEIVEGSDEKGSVKIAVADTTPKKLWGLPGPTLQPCGSKHLTSKQRKALGYVLVKLSDNPLYHPMQVADAVIVARSLGGSLVLPKLRKPVTQTSGGFSSLYNVRIFASSLKGVVQVVARLPEDLHGMKPTIVKVPYKVTPDYIDAKVRPVFEEKHVIQVTSVFSTFSPSIKDPSTEEMQAIRCLVAYSALQFHPKVTELGERVVNSIRKESGSDRFVAVDLHIDMLNHTACMQSESLKGKRCFDPSDIAAFLRSLGFSSGVPIYLTQPTWDQRLDVLKEEFLRVYTKDKIPALAENQEMGKQTQLEKALDLYICTHSDVFVPAISGISYVNIAGHRITTGRTQILVPTVVNEGSSLKLPMARAISRFVTKKDHDVYSCFCKSSSSTNKLKQENFQN